MPGIPYTPAEDRTIKANAGKISSARIAELLPGRTLTSIRMRAYFLKVSLRLYGTQHHSASDRTAEDVELCRQLRDEGLPALLIAEKMEVPYSWVLDITNYRTRNNS